MVTNMTTPDPQRFVIASEVEVTVTDPAALEAHVLKTLDDDDASFSEPEEKAEVQKDIVGDPRAAIEFLFDPAESLDLIDGVVAWSSTWTVSRSIDRQARRKQRMEASPEEETRRMTAQLIVDARKVDGIDFLFDGDGDDEGLEETVEEATHEQRQLVLIKGLMWHACNIIIDHAFIDMAEIAESDESLEAAIADSWTFGELPLRFAKHYSTMFQRRFTAALIEVSERLAVEWRPLPTVAHELALRIFLNQVEASSATWSIDLDEGWRGMIEDHLFEDTDHEYLYDDAADGFENDPEFGPVGMTSMKFGDWFTPFNQRHVSPYIGE